MIKTHAVILGALVSLGLSWASGCGILAPQDGNEGGGSSCDGKGDCESCAECAGNEYCRTALANCQQDSACIGLDQCLTLCAGLVQCEQECYLGNQAGRSLHDTLRICLLCQACPNDCSGFTTCE